jgi:hypothetical protein
MDWLKFKRLTSLKDAKQLELLHIAESRCKMDAYVGKLVITYKIKHICST